MESIAVSMVYASKKGYKLDPDQEAIALGLANIVGSFFSAYPTTGGFSRTAVCANAGQRRALVGGLNVLDACLRSTHARAHTCARKHKHTLHTHSHTHTHTGANTQLACIIAGLIMFVVLAALTPLFYHLPRAVLGAIVVFAVSGLVDTAEPLRLWKTVLRERGGGGGGSVRGERERERKLDTRTRNAPYTHAHTKWHALALPLSYVLSTPHPYPHPTPTRSLS